MALLDRTGVFEARVIDAEIQPASSGAIMANFEFEVIREFDKASKQYSEIWPEGYTFRGNVCLVKKNAEIMKDSVQRLRRSMGWTGDVKQIGACIGFIVKCTVDSEEYPPGSGQLSYKAKYIDPAGEVDVSDIDDKFGAMFQAYASEVGPITPNTSNAPATTPAAAPIPPVPITAPAPTFDTPADPAKDIVPF